VQIFKRPLNLCVVYFPHHCADTTHLLGTRGAQTRVGREPCNFACEFITHKKSIARLEFMFVAPKYPDILICALQVTSAASPLSGVSENNICSVGREPCNFACEFITHKKSIPRLDFMFVAPKYPDILICALQVTSAASPLSGVSENNICSVGGKPCNFACEFITHKQSIPRLEFMYVAQKYPDILICALQVTSAASTLSGVGKNNIRSVGGKPCKLVCCFIIGTLMGDVRGVPAKSRQE